MEVNLIIGMRYYAFIRVIPIQESDREGNALGRLERIPTVAGVTKSTGEW
jgi:hypothetical protein